MNTKTTLHLFRLDYRYLGALLSALLVISPSAHATQWKWLNSEGQVQYSDRPPPNSVPDEKILKRPGSGPNATKPAADAAASSSPVKTSLVPDSDPALEKKKKEAEEAEAQKRKEKEDKQAQIRADNCLKAQTQAKALDQGIRMSRLNANGEREILDEKGMAEEKNRNNQLIASNCR